MVLDSSVLVALVLGTPIPPEVSKEFDQAAALYVGAPTVLETAMVLTSRIGENAVGQLDVILRVSGVSVLPFTADHAMAAQRAFVAFGKGRHPASLNYGDCMSYAVAKVAEMPLLYIGEDFSQTDLA